MHKYLNIGCYLIYKPGYINIDQHNDDIADVIARPYEIPEEDQSVDLIESYNLLEQLSHEEGLMAIEEWFRILKPGASLIIETFNCDETIREYHKAEDNFHKDHIINSLYDSEDGYKLRSSYFFSSLTRLLQQTGFVDIQEEIPKLKNFQYNMRFRCKKPEEAIHEMALIKTKKNIINALNLLSDNNNKMFWEFNHAIADNLMKSVLLKIQDTPLNKNPDFLKIATYSPKAARFFIGELYNSRIIELTMLKQLDKTLECLIKFNYVMASYKNYLDLDKIPGQNINYYLEILEKNSAFLEEVFKTPADILDKLIKTHFQKTIGNPETLKLELNPDIYSFEHIIDFSGLLMFKGLKAYSKPEYEVAYNLLTYSKDLNPDLILAHTNLALLEAYAGRYQNSLKHFDIATSITENDITKLYSGMCKFYMKDYEEAINTVLPIEEDSQQKFLILGNAYYLLKDYDEAVEAFSWASILNESAQAYVNLGIAYEKIGDKTQAQINFNKAKKLQPDIRPSLEPYQPVFRQTPLSIEEIQHSINIVSKRSYTSVR